MAKRVDQIPSYRLHRPSDRAVVTLNGMDHFPGPWKSKESKEACRRLIATGMTAGGHLLTRADDSSLTTDG